jgi:hypothetical protein
MKISGRLFAAWNFFLEMLEEWVSPQRCGECRRFNVATSRQQDENICPICRLKKEQRSFPTNHVGVIH